MSAVASIATPVAAPWWTTPALAEMVRRARRGDTWRAIGAAVGHTADGCATAWRRYATDADEEARAAALAARLSQPKPWKWRPEVVATVIAIGRTGQSWTAIGAAMCPSDPDPVRAGTRMRFVFFRAARPDDRIARRRAMRALNYNKPPGITPSSASRRRRKGVAIGNVVPQVRDPWAGMGDCFATRRAA